MTKLRIAAFGFRSIPPSDGAAGADKFALELLPRLIERGHSVIAYNRNYPGNTARIKEFKGVKIKTFTTSKRKGLDTLLHSAKCTIHIIFKNTADIVHIQNGGNSIWALPLRIFGKKVFISQDGVDWKRDKWPWYGKLYLRISAFLTSILPNQVIFDNTIAKKLFENKFKKKFVFIPFGSEIQPVTEDRAILNQFSVEKGEYYLFIGRFIPDKGLHYLLPAFIKSNTKKKLILIGGSPNPSTYEQEIRAMGNEKVIFGGYIYGDDVSRLMLNAYCYIQPSDVEGLSPVILTVMGLGVPMIVSDIEENLYAVGDTVTTFAKGSIDSLAKKINFAENNYNQMMELAIKAKDKALREFNWDKVTNDHIEIFRNPPSKKHKA
jgi:glycosyltransferase involved in cell wall biosynthesis